MKKRLITAVPASLVCLMLALATLVVACGRKAPPRLPDVQPPAPIADLETTHQDDQVVLTWLISTALQDQIAAVRVLRSMRPMDQPPCDGCPLIFQPLATLAVPRTNSRQADAVAMQYEDDIAAGFVYIYKLSTLDANGSWINDSNTATIQIPAPLKTLPTTEGASNPAPPEPSQPSD